MSDTEDAEAWPPSLDALVAATAPHTLLFENDAVRVLDTCIAPGSRTPVHTHHWPSALYVRTWSSFIRRDNQGKVLVDSRTVPSLAQPPKSLWTPVLPPHSLENVGEHDLHVISVKLKHINK